MKYFDKNNKLTLMHKDLNKIIRKPEMLETSKNLFINLYSELKNQIDNLFLELKKSENENIIWNLWHIIRIEDLTVNILIREKESILNEKLKKEINISITDTGNSLTKEEIKKLAKDINIDKLKYYSDKVSERTINLIKRLKAEDMKRKINKISLEKIIKEGGVSKDNLWLIYYWGKKDIAGLLLMPLSRHIIVHLNQCYKYIKTESN
ncbi:DinB family protein [Brachyspira catarrhinii]|uniref:DinB family protein n=1 Tax=Brachyspira catarrhinii TaxID=2528966 RepID=A0ABY2TR78_9SPIR|nr:DinB family protein [Brachyspira catarrhinii]TKZ35357.1 DinB family protein [Brachyspira catarrhinii]